MKTFTFNRKSYHYTLADRGGFYESRWEDEHDDLCKYLRCVFKGLLVTMLVMILASAAGLVVVDVLAAIGFSLYHGMWIFGPIASVALFITGVLTGAILIVAGGHWLKNAITENSRKLVQKEDGFVGVAYRSWKDKFCARLSFTGDKNED